MGQITEGFAKLALKFCEEKKHPSLTIWETQQLLTAWLDRESLRAEVASLKEERDKAIRQVDIDWVRRQEITRLTQQLSAANGRVEMLRGTLASVKGAIDSMPATAAYDFLPDGLEEEIDAALSNLNEDSAG